MKKLVSALGADGWRANANNIVQQCTANQRVTAWCIPVCVGLLAVALCSCRADPDRAVPATSPTTPPQSATDAPSESAPPAPLPEPALPSEAVNLDVRSARPRSREAWPEPERVPHGLTVLSLGAAGDDGTRAVVVLVDGQQLRSWAVSATGSTRELRPVPLGEDDQLVAARLCGGVALPGGPAVVAVRRRAGAALEPVFVPLPTETTDVPVAVGRLTVPDAWQLTEAGAQPCVTWVDADGRVQVAFALSGGTLGVARYDATDAALDRVGASVWLDGEHEQLDALPALGLAVRDGRALLGYRARRDASRVYEVAVVDGAAIGSPTEVARHERAAVFAAPAWRGDVPGAWSIDWTSPMVSDSTVAQPDVPLVWRPLADGGAEEPVSSIALAGWREPVHWLDVTAPGVEDGLLLLQPEMPSRRPERLGALVAPAAPDGVLAVADGGVTEVAVAPWGRARGAALMSALRWMRGDETTTGASTVELTWHPLQP